jgi:hypothetical protein
MGRRRGISSRCSGGFIRQPPNDALQLTGAIGRMRLKYGGLNRHFSITAPVRAPARS